jgi:zinc transport system substrate-binding protein
MGDEIKKGGIFLLDFITSCFRSGLQFLRVPVLAVLLAIGLMGLTPAVSVSRPLQVTVSILPQVWFVEGIGGDLVEVSVLVGPGHSPATYEPTPKQMAGLEQADLFLAAGVPFEYGLVPRILALPRAPVVAGPQSGPHDHGHHHDTDPHTWLDPVQAMAMADTISSRLQILSPENAAHFESRRQELRQRLAALDTQVREILFPYRGRSFIVFHPAFGHFAAAYGLVQVPVEVGGHEPGPRHLAEVIDRAKLSGARSVIVQPQFSRKSAATVAAAIGAEIVVLDPLAPDYAENLLHFARTLAKRFAAEDTRNALEVRP